MSWLFRDRNAIVADQQMSSLLEAIQNKDKNAVTKLFAQGALQQTTDIDTVIEELFNYCSYEVQSYSSWTGVGPRVHKVRSNGEMLVEMFFTYDVQTANGIYRFAVKYISTDTKCPENVGIWSVYVMDWDEDTDVSYAYLGDRQYTTGIHVGVKNVLPEVRPGTLPYPGDS